MGLLRALFITAVVFFVTRIILERFVNYLPERVQPMLAPHLALQNFIFVIRAHLMSVFFSGVNHDGIACCAISGSGADFVFVQYQGATAPFALGACRCFFEGFFGNVFEYSTNGLYGMWGRGALRNSCSHVLGTTLCWRRVAPSCVVHFSNSPGAATFYVARFLFRVSGPNSNFS